MRTDRRGRLVSMAGAATGAPRLGSAATPEPAEPAGSGSLSIGPCAGGEEQARPMPPEAMANRKKNELDERRARDSVMVPPRQWRSARRRSQPQTRRGGDPKSLRRRVSARNA